MANNGKKLLSFSWQTIADLIYFYIFPLFIELQSSWTAAAEPNTIKQNDLEYGEHEQQNDSNGWFSAITEVKHETQQYRCKRMVDILLLFMFGFCYFTWSDDVLPRSSEVLIMFLMEEHLSCFIMESLLSDSMIKKKGQTPADRGWVNVL